MGYSQWNISWMFNDFHGKSHELSWDIMGQTLPFWVLQPLEDMFLTLKPPTRHGILKELLRCREKDIHQQPTEDTGVIWQRMRIGDYFATQKSWMGYVHFSSYTEKA